MRALTTALVADPPDGVEVPAYDRAGLRAGIAHLGVGSFHRSHQAVYVDDLLTRGRGRDWAIVGIGVLPDGGMGKSLRAQDMLYSVSVKHGDGRIDDRVIGSLVDYVYAADEAARAHEVLTDPSIRIVSLTITEGGYVVEPTTGGFDEAAARAQVAAADAGLAPRPAFELLLDALEARRAAGTPPFTVMSCDNVRGNGRVARQAMLGFAALRGDATAAWVERSVAFPNSMVDRITPATTPDDVEALARRRGYRDARPVVCEPYLQWVVEDEFPGGRPPLEEVGVTFVDHVEAYELMKLRLLNASHQVIGQLGRLAGIDHVHDVLAEPAFRRCVELYMTQEAAPTLVPIPGVDFAAYGETLVHRFSNPAIADTTDRLCAFASDRITPWILPVAEHNAETGGAVGMCALTVAAWSRTWLGRDDTGSDLQQTDNRAEILRRASRGLATDPLALLRERDVVGDFRLDERFETAYLRAWRLLEERGARGAARAMADEAGRA